MLPSFRILSAACAPQLAISFIKGARRRSKNTGWLTGHCQRPRRNQDIRGSLSAFSVIRLNRTIEPAVLRRRPTGMQGIDVVFAVLSVVVAVCAASYCWIFLYRPTAFRFSLPQLEALVWYKRLPGHVYFVFASFGLG